MNGRTDTQTGLSSPYVLIFSGVLSTLALITLPILIASIVDQFSWGVHHTGWLASADMSGSAVAGLFTLTRASRFRWKHVVLVGVILTVVANTLCLFQQEFVHLWLCRFLSGVGNGLVLTICFVGMCRSDSPDRAFGLYVFFQVVLQIILLRITPSYVDEYGLNVIYIFFIASALSVAVAIFVQADVCDRYFHSGFRLNRIKFPEMMALVALASYFLAPSAVWGYLETIGRDFSLSIAQVSGALSWASFGGVIGGYSVVYLSGLNRRLTFIGLGCCLSILSLFLLVNGNGYTEFLLAAIIFNFSWNFTFPFQMGLLADLSKNDYLIVLSLVVQLASLALGPVLISIITPAESESINYSGLFYLCICCYLLSFSLFVFSQKKHKE